MLREERASGSENGDLIETYMKEGKIVPVEITISLIEKVKKSNIQQRISMMVMMMMMIFIKYKIF